MHASKKFSSLPSKREQRYYEFKLDVYKQTGDKQTDRQETDLVLEVTPPEVGLLKTTSNDLK